MKNREKSPKSTPGPRQLRQFTIGITIVNIGGLKKNCGKKSRQIDSCTQSAPNDLKIELRIDYNLYIKRIGQIFQFLFHVRKIYFFRARFFKFFCVPYPVRLPYYGGPIVTKHFREFW